MREALKEVNAPSTPASPTRVLVLVPSLAIGGAERHICRVFPELEKRGFSCSVIPLRSGGPLESELRATGLQVARLPVRKRSLLGRLLTVLDLAREIKRLKPDLLHFFLPEAYLLGIPASLGTSALRIMSRRSLAAYQRKRLGIRLLEILFHRWVDVALGNSNAVVAELRQERVPYHRLGLIHNGTEDIMRSTRVDGIVAGSHLTQEILTFICVANFWVYKGHADLIEALREIKTRIPQAWRLVMIGRDEGVLGNIQESAILNGIAENIEVWSSVKDVNSALQEADIFVLPSHEEGFSNALIEAMMAGLPIVATAVGGNLDAIRTEVDGLLVPAQDPHKLGEALLRLASDSDLRLRLGRNAQSRARANFSLENCVEKYFDLYSGLVDGRYPPLPETLLPDRESPSCAE